MRGTNRCGRTECFDGLHRTQQSQQRPDIVDAYIIWQRTAISPEKSEYLGVQGLVAVDDRQPGSDGADHIGIQRLAGCLQARSQHSIRRYAQVQPFPVRQGAQFPGFRHGHGHHFFGPDMLAGFQHLPDDAVVCKGGGQVDHQFDVR